MPAAMMITSVALIPHPDYPAPGIRALMVACRGLPDGSLELHYRLAGDLASLCLPDRAHPVEADRLWAHSCFEVFLARADSRAYREYNFSPSGQWAGYGFGAYRQRREGLELPAPCLDWQAAAGCLELIARLPGAALAEGAGALQLGLTSVLELADGRLSYWALHHPAPRPDFHHRNGFILTLTTPP